MNDGSLIYLLPNSEIEILIREWIHAERDRRLLERRYIDGITYEALAEEFGLSVRHTKTIIYKHSKTIVERSKNA